MRSTHTAAALLFAIALVAPGCIGMEEEDEDMLEQEQDEDELDDELEVPDDAELQALDCRATRITKRNAKTVYLKICRTVGSTRRDAWVVDECASGTSWRIVRSGSVVKSGFQPHCNGGNVYVSNVNAPISLQVLVTTGSWAGLSY